MEKNVSAAAASAPAQVDGRGGLTLHSRITPNVLVGSKKKSVSQTLWPNFDISFLLLISILTSAMAGTADAVSLTSRKGHVAGLFSIFMLNLICFQSNFF